MQLTKRRRRGNVSTLLIVSASMIPVQVLGHSAFQQSVERADITLTSKTREAGITNLAPRCSVIGDPYRHLTRDCATNVFNVLDFGIKGDGTTDDAPKMRALCGSNRTLLFPSNHTYHLATTVASGYPAYANAAFLCSQATNFHVIANGAVFETDPTIALSQAVLIDRGMHWTWDGGTITHNRTGLTSTQENVGFGLVNNVDFRVSGVRFAPGLGGLGGALVGDYNVNGKISRIQMDGVGIGVDMAFSKNLFFEGIRATGADSSGLSDMNHVGDKFWSNIYDAPLAPPLIVSAPVMTGAKVLPLTSVVGLSVGMVVISPHIPIGAIISAIDISAKKITLSAPTTGVIHPTVTLFLKTSTISAAGTTSLSVLSATGVTVGMTIYGTGISSGTIITAVSTSTNTLNLSKKLLGSISVGTRIGLQSLANLNAQFNYTGYYIPDTENVSLINSDFSHFATGVALSSGSRYMFLKNTNHNNPGRKNTAGIGYYIYYVNGGKFSSVGHSVRDVTIKKGWIHDIGSPCRGYGVYIDASQVENGDFIDMIKIKGVRIERTATSLTTLGRSIRYVSGVIP